MLSNGFAIPIRVNPVPSRYYRRTLFAAHALALLAIILSNALPLWLQCLLGGMVLLGGWAALSAYGNKAQPVWVSQTAQNWLSHVSGQEQRWQLVQVVTVTNWFVAFNLQDETGKKNKLLWFFDQMDEQTFRRLRVRLRYAQVEATSPGETS